jgi:hypothetical protein
MLFVAVQGFRGSEVPGFQGSRVQRFKVQRRLWPEKRPVKSKKKLIVHRRIRQNAEKENFK